MNPTIIYLLKVNIAIALFLLFYRLFFSGDTLWKARRIYLMGAVLISFTYPLMYIQHWFSNNDTLHELAVEYVQLQEFVVSPAVAKVFPWNSLIAGIYLLVVAVLLLRIIIQFVSILALHIKSTTLIVQGVKVRSLEKEITPFSFFNTIYFNPSLHTNAETYQILTHERTHVRQWHSVDVVVAELLCAILWINPFVWLMRREIRQNLEYLADDRVVASGVDSKQYQYHLLQLSCQLTGFQLTNKFNISPLKKRIRMMNQARSSKTTVLKYLLIAPLTFSLVVLSNAENFAASLGNMLKSENLTGLLAETNQIVKSAQIATANDTPSTVEELIAATVEEVQIPKKEEKQSTVQVGESNQVNEPPRELTVIAYPPVKSKEDIDEDPVFIVVETMPSYPGGEKALFKYLADNVKYPVAAQEKGIQGKVICQFVIDKDGKITDIEVVRSVSHVLDAEAIRVIKMMPNWVPGQQRGKTVKVKYTLPVNFRLEGKDTETSSPKKPLIVLNDKAMDPGFDLNSIVTADIEEVTVLKGGDADSLEKLIQSYGERAKDGVILIKMKKQ